MKPKPTIKELEEILDGKACEIEILPNGEVRAVERREKMKPEKCPVKICIMIPFSRQPLVFKEEAYEDCPDTCPIVKLKNELGFARGVIMKLGDGLHEEITTLKKETAGLKVRVNALAQYKKDSMAMIEELKEGEDCPDCDNSGYQFPGEYRPEDIEAWQCKWCHENPNSKFNKKRWKK